MADHSAIEWCDRTHNEWEGCTKVSPACDHCYAERDRAIRLGTVKWGAGQPRRLTSQKNRNNPHRWNARPFYECPGCGWRGEEGPTGLVCPWCMDCVLEPARQRVFALSLGDWLDNEVPIAWLAGLLDTVRLTPNLDWLLLSKRIGLWHARLTAVALFAKGDLMHDLRSWVCAWLDGRPPAHVYVGATICNQPEADRDMRKLLRVPARVRFVSMEPLLGLVSLTSVGHIPADDEGPDRIGYMVGADDGVSGLWPTPAEALRRSGLHWVIDGGESGPHARPSHPAWSQSLRDQCAEAGLAYLHKQNGEWMDVDQMADGPMTRRQRAQPICTVSVAGDVYPGWHRDRADDARMCRVGKREAGRLLDGVEHNGFPVVPA